MTTDDAWQEYLAAAQRLDAVRRQEAAFATRRARALHTARDELTAVRARLAPQRARLAELGVPPEQLAATAAEISAATQQLGREPEAVLAALRQARSTADMADATVAGQHTPMTQPTPWLRNVMVYAPFAVTVVVVQIVLFLVAGDASSVGYLALCALTMPAAAFGLGWVTVGLAFPPGPGERLERTPLLGAVVCFAPVLASCVGFAALRVLS